jgi:hypothetical protein
MAITTGAGDGIRVTTAAKNGTLGSQTGAGTNQIILDTTWAAVNNGNTNSILLGRLLILRRGTATEETKKIIAGTSASTTVTVHEDWTVAPASSDTYHIAYCLDDCTALTGCTLSSKTGVYEFTRRLSVGTSGGGAFAYFSITDQQAMETYDNGATPSLVCESGARFDIGYKFGGEPVGGGIIHCLQNTTNETAINFMSGSIVKWYDPTIIAFRALLGWFCFTTSTDGRGSNIELRNAKVVNHSRQIEFHATGSYTDIVWASSLTTGSTQGVLFGSSSFVDTWTLVGPYLSSTGSGRTETIEVRNITWVGPYFQNIIVEQSKSWNVVNPIWTVVTNSHRSIGWVPGAGNRGQVFEKFSLAATTVSASGAGISGSSIYVYEGLTNKNLPHSGVTNLTGSYNVDVQTRRITSGATTLIVTTSGDFAVKAYRYGFQSFAGGQTFAGPVTSQITFNLDSNLTVLNENTALVSGSSSIGPVKHGPAQTDPLPMKVIHYISGAGTIPSTGQKVSGVLSAASGSVVEVVYGDNADAYLVLSGWNGRQFYHREVIGNGAGWSGSSDLSLSVGSFNQEYTWEYKCDSFALQTVYNFDRAKMAQFPVWLSSSYRNAIIWGEDEQTHMFYSDGTNYYTPRNVNLQQGVWLAKNGGGTISYMTSDSGSQFVPPTTVTFELTGLQLNTEVRIYNAATDAEITGIENTVTDTFSYSYIYAGSDIDIYVVIFHLSWKDIRLTGLTLSNTDQSIPIQQLTDRVYSNP